MMDQNGATLNIFRGLTGAVICALGGVTVPVALLSAFAVCRWYALGATESDWHWEMGFLKNAFSSLIPGFAAVFGAAGWATYAPRGEFRLAKTLAILFVFSLSLWYLTWFAAEWIGLEPQNSKEDYGRVEFAGLLVLVAAPILAAAVLTAIRLYAVKHRPSTGSPPSSEKSSAR